MASPYQEEGPRAHRTSVTSFNTSSVPTSGGSSGTRPPKPPALNTLIPPPKALPPSDPFYTAEAQAQGENGGEEVDRFIDTRDPQQVIDWLLRHRNDDMIRRAFMKAYGLRLPPPSRTEHEEPYSGTSIRSRADSVPPSPASWTREMVDQMRIATMSASPTTLAGTVQTFQMMAERRPQADEPEVVFDTVDTALVRGLTELLRKVIEVLPANRPVFTIRFDDLNYTADVTPTKGAGIVTVGSALKDMFCGCRKPKKVQRRILKDLTGTLRPGTLTLVLGAPRSGKSSFMKVLSGRATENASCRVTGRVTYNGDDRSQVLLSKLCGYISQHDQHYATLTVRETVKFAADCLLMDPKDPAAHVDPDKIELMRKLWLIGAEIQLNLLGIAHVGDTIIGDELLRGISGGQKRRVTSAEMLAGHHPVLFADEISNGLDSASTFDICQTLAIISHVVNFVGVVSLLQPPPEVFELFDDVIIFDKGHIIYHGPIHEAVPYFEGLGYKKPDTMDVCDYLQEVATEAGHQFIDAQNPPEVPPPKSAEEFARAYKASELFKQREEEYLGLAASPKAPDPANPKNFMFRRFKVMYPTPWRRSFMILLRRQAILMLRNTTFLRARIMQMIIFGILLGTLFLQLGQNDFQLHYAVMFNALMLLSLGGMAQMPQVIQDRPVLYKQLNAGFFPPSAFTAAYAVVQIPVVIVEVILLSTLLYWLTGLAPNVFRYFFFMFIAFITSLAMSAFLRLIAVVAPTISQAQGLASFSILMLILFCGFMIPKSSIKPWWVWCYWISPLSYSFVAVSLNQFKASTFDTPVNPNNTNSARKGDVFLEVKGLTTDASQQWVAIAFILAFYGLMSVLFCLIIRYLRWPETYDPETIMKNREHAQAAAAAPSIHGHTHSESAGSVDVPIPAPPPPRRGSSAADYHAIIGATPHTPMTLSFHDITYKVDLPDEKKKFNLTLLNRVSGFARPGTITALMGSSGAGKTTLLDVLAGRKTSGKITGSILLNGQPMDALSFSRVAGYVEQMDIHSPSSTVLEALRFSAHLRLPQTMTEQERDGLVEYVIELLELEPIRDLPIGFKGNGLSTEQVKRVTIGVEMVANPSILFLDEPTSGLDSTAALVVMRAIQNVAKSGRTVVCTIHQPSKLLFSMFDSLLLLKKGGETVYFGELGDQASNLIDFFQAAPGTQPITLTQNPATWMLEVITAKPTAPVADETAAATSTSSATAPDVEAPPEGAAPSSQPLDFAHFYRSSALFRENEAKLGSMDPIAHQGGPVTGTAAPAHRPCFLSFGGCSEGEHTNPMEGISAIFGLGKKDQYAQTNRVQIEQLFRKFWKIYWRSPQYNFSRSFLMVIIALLLGTVYLQLDLSNQSDLFSCVAVQFLALVFMGVLNFSSVLPMVATERAVFYREKAANMYAPHWYGMILAVVEMPYLIVNSFLFVCIFYFMVGLRNDAGVFLFWWLTFFLMTSFMTFFGIMLVVLLPNAETAQLAGTGLVSIWNSCAGFMISVDSIPAVWKFLYYINPISYALQAVLSTQFFCEGDDCPKTTALNPATGQQAVMSVWQYTRDAFGLKYDLRWMDIGILLACMMASRILTVVGLRFVSHLTR